jgi:serine/threonine protein kinase/Tol biopolymer transport system component
VAQKAAIAGITGMSMTPERWQQIKVVLEDALKLRPQQRSGFVAKACSDDPALRQEVESFLALEDEVRFSPMIGETISHYRIVGELGSGGMGVVYKAEDIRLHRFVALKFLPENLCKDRRSVQRFEREARSASSLNHPNICTIYEVEEHETQPVIVMEWLQGENLKDRIRKRPLPTDEVIDLGIQIADALEAAHIKGIIHRDIKPANIFVIGENRVKVLDFGLAKALSNVAAAEDEGEEESLTMEGAVLGTSSYMSPEQVRGEELDGRSDLFSLGVVLYELATGKRPFVGKNRITILDAILHVCPKSPTALNSSLPAELDTMILKALEKSPGLRYQHASELRSDLQQLKRKSESASQRVESASDLAFVPKSLSDSSTSPGNSIAQMSSRRVYLWFAAVTIAVMVALAVAATAWLRRSGKANDNSAWLQITDLPDVVSEPALSPDGRTLTFIRGGAGSFAAAGQIYVKMLPDGEPVQLTHDHSQKMSPAFSPDGTQIAYTVVTRENQYDTWTVPLMSGQAHLWLPNASGLVWSSRGKIFFSEIKNNDIHMAIESADQSRAAERDVYIPAGDRAMAHRSYPSPDGRWVLIAEMDRGVWLPCRLVPTDGSAAGRPVGPPRAACIFAGWSPDGKWMYLNSDAGGTFHVWRQRFPNGQPQQITSGPTEEEGIAIAADGRSFITAVGIRQSSVWVHDPNGERQVSVEGYSYDPEFTPDGKKLCYRISKGGLAGFQPGELRLVDVNSGSNESLLPGLAVIGLPGNAYDVSPDSKLVVVAAPDGEGTKRLWIAPLDLHSPPRQIANVKGDNPLFASNNEILFRAIDRSEAFVYSVRADGTNLRKIVEAPIATLEGISPGGQWLVVRLPGARGASVTAFPLGGGSPVLITAPGVATDHALKWSSDGRWLFFVRLERNLVYAETYALPLSRGRLLPRSPAGGFTVEADMTKTSGSLTIPDYAAPGPTVGTYAFVRVTAQRNMFRVPLHD